MPFTVTPLSPVMGATIEGLDLGADIDDQTLAAVLRAWHEAGGLLVFKRQHLSPEAQIAFSRRLGPLERHTLGKFLLPGYPEIYRVSTKRGPAGEALGNDQAGRYWHSDLCYLSPPSLCSILYALEVPRLGGDTLFCNTHRAWKGLSEPMREFLAERRAVHDFRYVFRLFSSFGAGDVQTDLPPVSQPVVRVHADTGRHCLYVNPGFTTHIEGLRREESDALLAMLFAHMDRPEYVYRHRWSAGDVLMWDNRCTMHRAVPDFSPDDGPRHMHRTTVMDTQPA
ncbi:MAG: TauD/TfdA family dioxygenase [Ectothiorhodospiraceae bacterium]|nr:TauD/TfdA family dioxygenase [Ectothiorhodospiraceae bacterium]